MLPFIEIVPVEIVKSELNGTGGSQTSHPHHYYGNQFTFLKCFSHLQRLEVELYFIVQGK